MRSPVSFFGALWGTCSGISVFWGLRLQSWGRTIWHVFLMGFLCAVLITWGENRRMRPMIQAGVNVFKNTFGEKILCEKAGFLPEKSPGTSRFVVLPNNGVLFYLADGRLRVDIPALEKNSYLLIWAPKGLMTCVQVSSGTWQVSMISPGKDRIELSGKKDLTSSQLLDMRLVSPWDWRADGIKFFSVDELGKVVSGMTGITYFIQNILLTLLLPLLYTGIFVGMFRLTSGGRFPVCLTYREFWKIGLYAGFPALLIASAFPALDLPFFTFSTVYMIDLLSEEKNGQ